MSELHDDITDVPGIEVGQWTDAEAATGCTVVLTRAGAVAAVDQRGGAPGSRETDLLAPANTVERVHAVVLAGGSAFGLDAAGGVMRWLEERGIGFDTSVAKVPIVTSAILFDLALGSATRRPGADDGYAAADAASTEAVVQGTAGAGTGAMVGTLMGRERATKGGLGSASERLANGAMVAALVALNAVGEIVDPESGLTVAGIRGDSKGFLSAIEGLRAMAPGATPLRENTTLICVATDVALTRGQALRVAMVAHAGLARTVRPAHLPVDGDTLFVLATAGPGAPASDVRAVMAVGALAARAVERAVLKAVRAAAGLHGVPAASDWPAG